MKIIITCHSELGTSNNKIISFDKKYIKNVESNLVNTLNIIRKNRAKIFFAIMPEIIDYFDSNIINSDIAEIGLHIHPDDNLLIKKGVSDYKNKGLRNYNYKKQKKMINTGKKIIEKEFDVNIQSFVAGKWSINNDTTKILEELKFDYDCSPCPQFTSEYCDWSDLKRISLPYTPDINDYQSQGNINIAMIPVSKDILGGVASPENLNGLNFLKACFKEYYTQNLPLFHICLHSPSMFSIYYQKVFDNLLQYINIHKVEYILPNQIDSNLINQNASIDNKITPYLKKIDLNIIKNVLRSI